MIWNVQIKICHKTSCYNPISPFISPQKKCKPQNHFRPTTMIRLPEFQYTLYVQDCMVQAGATQVMIKPLQYQCIICLTRKRRIDGSNKLKIFLMEPFVQRKTDHRSIIYKTTFQIVKVAVGVVCEYKQSQNFREYTFLLF